MEYKSFSEFRFDESGKPYKQQPAPAIRMPYI